MSILRIRITLGPFPLMRVRRQRIVPTLMTTERSERCLTGDKGKLVTLQDETSE